MKEGGRGSLFVEERKEGRGYNANVVGIERGILSWVLEENS